MSIVPDDKAYNQAASVDFLNDGWNSSEAPANNEQVEVYSSDHRGFYVIPFPVVFCNDCWLNAATGEELVVYIEGWRPCKTRRK